MPKIPTFTAQGRPTAEAPSVRTGVQVSPTTGVAAALLPATKSVQDYFIKQRDNNEKLEAKKKFYEMKSESDKIIERYKNNSDEFASVNGYNEEFGTYKQQELSQIKNKRVKKRLQDLLDIDQSENIYKIKANSFDAFERESKVTYETEQNSLANDYTLATSIENKQKILNKRINSAAEYENMHKKGKAWLDQTVNKIKGDSELSDVEKAINNKDYSTAMSLLKQSKNIDNDEVKKAALKIQKESLEFNETNFYVDQLLKGKNPFLIADPKHTTEKKVLETVDNLLLSQAEKNQADEQTKFAYVDGAYTRTGILSPYYEDLFKFAYNAGSTTTFDSPADVPQTIIQAVEAAEIADRTGRLNTYTSQEEERFFRNVIILKKIKGLNDFEAIKQAKEFEMNYDERKLIGASRQRNRMLEKIESDDRFKKSKATNIGEVRAYAGQLYDIYVSFGIDDRQAQDQVIKDLKSSIIEIDNHAYLKRDIEAFKSVGGLDQVKFVKELIIKDRLKEEDPDDFYLRHNGGGQFEIRREVDISPVSDDNGQPLIFYAKDLEKFIKTIKIKQEEEKEARVKKLQDIKQIRGEETQLFGLGPMD